MTPPSNPPSNPPLLAFTMGDPAGIGPEILVRALSHYRTDKRFRPIVLGDPLRMAEACARWGEGLTVNAVSGLPTAPQRSGHLPVWDAPADLTPPLARVDLKLDGLANLPEARWLCAAVRGCLRAELAAMVTAPICKEAMYARGFRYPGHTEFLAALCGSPTPIMAFSAPRLKVSLVTVHEPLVKVSSLLTVEKVLETLRISARGLRDFFGLTQPRLALCGLNPHAGEHGHLGLEEQQVLEPALQQARAEGLQVTGPLPADVVFRQAVEGAYDLVVAMYHDQGLIPVKLLSFGQSVNLTLGLPLVRTSVDHGVAYDIAGQGKADPSSLEAALELALEIVAQRSR